MRLKRAVIVLGLLTTLLCADDLSLLNKEKQELREVEKKILEQKHEASKNSWISPVNMSGSITRNHSFSEESNNLRKAVSIGFSQSVFESGGIGFTIDYANDKFKSDLLAWENENKQILLSLYNTLLEINKLNIELKQNKVELENAEIELTLKRIQYENGNSDITELNDAIMAKNNQRQQNVNLQNSLKQQKIELAKYTTLQFEEIQLLNFSAVDEKTYLNNHIDLLYEDALVQLAQTAYNQQKTDYLPKLSFSASASYTHNEDMVNEDKEESTDGSVGLTLSMPLYDINKKPTLEKARLEILKQKVTRMDLKNELLQEFEAALNKINTYREYNQILKENIALYGDLIEVNQASNAVGMSSDFDLEILKNTKVINEYGIEINHINMQQEYAKLYFKVKAN